MTTPRKPKEIISENVNVKDGIQVGDILMFKRSSTGAKTIDNATAVFQGLTESNEAKSKKHTESTHAAVVVGKTLDGIPIISHVIAEGNKTERLDCSLYKYQEFDTHSVKNGIVRMEISAMADQQPEVTRLLEQTTSRTFSKNPSQIQELLEQAGLKGDGDVIFQKRHGAISYSILKAAQAAGSAALHSSTLDNQKDTTQVEQTPDFNVKYNIGADENNKNKEVPDKNKPAVQFNGSQFCVSLVILAFKEADKKLKGDVAVAYANTNLAEVGKLPSDWNQQIQELQIENRTSKMLPTKLNELLSNASGIIDTNSSVALRKGEKAQEYVGLEDKRKYSSTSLVAASINKGDPKEALTAQINALESKKREGVDLADTGSKRQRIEPGVDKPAPFAEDDSTPKLGS